MPGATYNELLTETAPARIESDAEYDRIRRRFGTLLRQRHRTAAEDRLYDLLLVLIQDYDQRHALPPWTKRLQNACNTCSKSLARRPRTCCRSSAIPRCLQMPLAV